VTRFYNIDEANDRLAELEPLLLALRDQRADLIRLRDLVLEATNEEEPTEDGAEQLRLLRLRMQGVIDQMQAAVAEIDRMGITLRDIESGLIDFPALVAGRQICLCWRLGEGPIEWWHSIDDGFSGRRPLIELASGMTNE
jgi:hypothetical protein